MVAADGRWLGVAFLLDTGADRTVLSSETYRRLGFVGVDATRNLGGVGGLAETVRVTSAVRFVCDDGGSATFRGDFAAAVEQDVLDMSVLGRDIMNMFAVVVERRSNVVTLLGSGHRYRIELGAP
jgi:predicted aspartyl protease